MVKNQTIYGIHSVKAALLNEKREHQELILHENHRNLVEKFKSKIVKISVLNKKEFKKRYGNEHSTQGMVLKTQEPNILDLKDFIKEEDKKDKSVILVLDQITDPQNIGSIMRSCALFDCKAVIVAKDNAPDLTPSLLKAASGAAELVNYYKVTNLKRSISNLKNSGYWVYGFDTSREKTTKISYAKKSVLVFGSEGKGIRELVKKECDDFIKLNMKVNSKYQIDSLNVSNATSIALYDFFNK